MILHFYVLSPKNINMCLVLVLQHYYEEDDKVSAMETMRNAFEANSENVTAEG